MPASERTTLIPKAVLHDQLRPDEKPPTAEPVRSAPKSRRFPTRTVALLAALMMLLAAGGVVLRQKAVRLQADLAAQLNLGQSQLEAGKTALKLANQEHKPGALTQAQSDFVAARNSFAAAKARADASKLLQWGSSVPGLDRYVKPRVGAVDRISDMGVNLAAAASAIAAVDLRLINPDRSTSAGSRLLTTLRTSTGDIAAIHSKLVNADRAIQGIDISVLSANQRQVLQKARSTVTTALNGITEFQRLTPALIEILGGNGRRTYLIEQVNAAELRSGGGFIGTESVVTVDNGTFKLVSSGDSYVFDGYLPDARPRAGYPYYVRPPGTLTGFYEGYSWSFEDTNFFPDFNTNAQWAEYFANLRQGLKPDAVFAMDYYAVADTLKVTGPINVPGYGVTFDANNLVDQVFARDLSNNATHKSILAAAAGPLVQAISTLPADRWPQLIQILNGAASQRHMQVHFNNGLAQSEMSRLGWTGALNAAQIPDFFMETEDNFGSNKANHFISRHYTVTLSKNGSSLHHHVVIDINDPPGGPAWYNHGYNGYVRLYTPKDGSGLHLVSGTPEYRSEIPPRYPNNDPPTGYTLTDGWIYITQNGHESGHFQLVFEYDTRWTENAGVHYLYWQKQAGTVDDGITVIWQVGGQSFKATGSLSRDQEIRLSAKGLTLRPAQQSTVSLPSLSF
jgi:uncharacterized protein DUF4012